MNRNEFVHFQNFYCAFLCVQCLTFFTESVNEAEWKSVSAHAWIGRLKKWVGDIWKEQRPSPFEARPRELVKRTNGEGTPGPGAYQSFSAVAIDYNVDRRNRARSCAICEEVVVDGTHMYIPLEGKGRQWHVSRASPGQAVRARQRLIIIGRAEWRRTGGCMARCRSFTCVPVIARRAIAL